VTDQPDDAASTSLLGPAQIRALAAQLGVAPSKTLGQNFVHDHNTIRRIVRAAELEPDESVLEVGPGLGSLTLGLLAACGHLSAVEIDPRMASQLASTVHEHAPTVADRLTVIEADALRLLALPDPQPTALVANLPYNVSVPVLLHLLAALPVLSHGVVMVQLEVADRLVAPPGSRVYGVPSAKLAWYATARRVATVGRGVFWPEPNVASGLVRFVRRDVPPDETNASRVEVFAVIDAAFAQRRKMMRSALAPWAGSPQRAEQIMVHAGVDPTVRGEQLDIDAFARIAAARRLANF
jgi:16S rRNA (adenine1518-N6/adenine1519-N6)-dimethyltransferase